MCFDIINAFHVLFGKMPKTPKFSVFNENSQWFVVFLDAKIGSILRQSLYLCCESKFYTLVEFLFKWNCNFVYFSQGFEPYFF